MKTSSSLQLPPFLVADGSVLVAEIEAYLASQPAALAAPRIDVPLISRYGSVTVAWDAGMPARHRTLADRLHHRPAAPVAIDTATHLRLMSRFLVAHGWVQNAMWDRQGRVCLLGASLAVLAAGYGTEDQARRSRDRLMEQFIGQDPEIRSVDQWNDAPGRRLADVHRQLDIAAARAQQIGI